MFVKWSVPGCCAVVSIRKLVQNQEGASVIGFSHRGAANDSILEVITSIDLYNMGAYFSIAYLVKSSDFYSYPDDTGSIGKRVYITNSKFNILLLLPQVTGPAHS